MTYSKSVIDSKSLGIEKKEGIEIDVIRYNKELRTLFRSPPP